jgi:hypothetical protein
MISDFDKYNTLPSLFIKILQLLSRNVTQLMIVFTSFTHLPDQSKGLK